ncbi:transcriptional regulator, SARP family protein [Streptomyces sp. CNQ-509]|uniref:AfsR/SARP family transcriptional regulator n=1 Tax=Streptomyces sp. CNQ-509 TaxID=444103 RepID=UPI00062DE16F|nr:BTAD domain-containing putative transcriptional regulator [Streptomyces sp. CNQ-509]AKH84583.1 transcriptional regulator, SARP family protein [Streptomyces sp. CNQ-509]
MEFHLLGPIEAAAADGRPVDLGPARQRSVLAALLLDGGRAVPTAQLVHRVWGHAAPQRATETLYSYLSRLRRTLAGSQATLHRSPDGYELAVGPAGSVDVHRFRLLLTRARAATTTTDAAAAGLFREALALWRGLPFPGVDTPWFNGVRDALAKELFAAELDSADVRLRLGDHAALLTGLAARSAAHPLDERLAAQYMTALYRCGRPADALDHYRRIRRLLAEELGIDPGRPLQQVHQAVLGGDPELSVPEPAGAAPVRRPESAPPAWLAQCQLPPDVRGFAGRTDLVARLAELLECRDAAPVVVSGSPGVGKSALAVHLGHRLRRAFPDGQWYVRLQGTRERPRDPADVLAALLRASGEDAAAIPESLEDRAGAFRGRAADRRVLLVLDDAADAEQVRPLLPGTAGVAVLVTSRSDLRGLTASHAAHPVPLDVLRPGEAGDLLAGILGERRVAAEPAAAARLAELCARLPLALRIAAANLAARPGRSLEAYADELAGDGRLAKLSIAGDREAAVRTAFDHSYAALEPAAARLFGLLGLHPGPDFTAASAAALLGCPPAAAEEPLDRLATAGLVQHTGADRFQFHDLLRLYAAERAAADPGHEAAWRRLCDWYLTSTDAATAVDFSGLAQLPRPRQPSGRFRAGPQALTWLDAERANLVAVVNRAATAGPYAIAWQLADQLRMFFFYRRHQPEWQATVTAALRAAEEHGDVLARGAMYHGLGLLRQSTGDSGAALAALHRALDDYRATGHQRGEAAILSNLAVHAGQHGEMRRALHWQEQGMEVLRSLDMPVQLANSLNTLGLIHVYLGQLGSGLACTTESIKVCLHHRQPPRAISPLINRSLVHHHLGRYEEALADATEALRLCREHRERHNKADAYEAVARAHLGRRRPDLAGPHAERALRTAREGGDPTEEADALITLARLHRMRGDLTRAADHLTAALALTRRCAFRHQEAEAHAALALLRLDTGDAATATDHAELALATARELDLPLTAHHALTALAAIAHATHTPGKAALHTAEAHRIEERTGYHPPPNPSPGTGGSAVLVRGGVITRD